MSAVKVGADSVASSAAIEAMELLIKTFEEILSQLDEIVLEVQSKKAKKSVISDDIFTTAYPTLSPASAAITRHLANILEGVVPTFPKEMCPQWKIIFEQMNEILKVAVPVEVSRESTLSKYRSILRRNGVHISVYDASLSYMGCGNAATKARKEVYRAKVEERNVLRGKAFVFYAEPVIEQISWLYRSDNLYERVLSIMLATGSRPIEVFKTTDYEVAPLPSKIIIRNVAKNSNEVMLERDAVRLTGQQIVDCVAELRKFLHLRPEMTNEEIHARVHIPLTKAFRSSFLPMLQCDPSIPWEANTTEEEKETARKEQISKLTVHKCRHLHGQIAWLLHGEPNRIPEETYIQQQLGHASADSTKSYLYLNVQWKEADATKRVIRPDADFAAFREPPPEPEWTAYIHTSRSCASTPDKIQAIADCLAECRDLKYRISQTQLIAKLGYSRKLVIQGYARARELGILPPLSNRK